MRFSRRLSNDPASNGSIEHRSFAPGAWAAEALTGEVQNNR
jgi:hypothetical protein